MGTESLKITAFFACVGFFTTDSIVFLGCRSQNTFWLAFWSTVVSNGKAQHLEPTKMKRALQFRSIACRLSATNQRQYSTEKTVFPWRHSPVALDRTVTVDDLSGQPQNQLALFFRYILASRELNKTYFQILLQSAWRKELAADFSYAFQVGIASLLAELFQGKFQ